MVEVALVELLVVEVASQLTPVPGGVGPLTTAILVRNTMNALRLQKVL